MDKIFMVNIEINMMSELYGNSFKQIFEIINKEK